MSEHTHVSESALSFTRLPAPSAVGHRLDCCSPSLEPPRPVRRSSVTPLTPVAPLLPWAQGQGWNTPGPSYDVHKLTADTLKLLTPDAPILARMENTAARDDLRRAGQAGRRASS